MLFKKNYDIPRTRSQMLWEIIRTRWLLLFGMSMLLLMFALPLIASSLFMQYGKATELDLLLSNAATAGIDLIICCFRWNFAELVLALLCGALFAVGLSGAAHVIQQLVWAEGVIFRQDFAAGIRENCRKYLLSTLFACLSYFSVQCNIDFAAYSQEEPALLVISSVLTTVASFVLAVSAVYIAAQSMQYKVTAAESIINALILSIAYFPRNFLLMLMIAGPIVIASVFGIPSRLIYFAVMGLFGFSLTILVTVLVCNRVLDLAINQRLNPDGVGRGLYKPPTEQEK